MSSQLQSGFIQVVPWLHPLSSQGFPTKHEVVAIFCNGMFVPKRGGTLAIFMFTG